MKNPPKKFKDKVHDIALRNMIPDNVAMEIFLSQFEFVSDIMKNANSKPYPIVFVRGFGRFIPKMFYLKEEAEENNESD